VLGLTIASRTRKFSLVTLKTIKSVASVSRL
jgi:hypothetical protein